MIKYLQNVFTPRDVQILDDFIQGVVRSREGLVWEENFNRFSLHNPKQLQKFHLLLEEEMSEFYGLKLKKSYCYIALYGPDGKCKRHTDRIQCQYTYDYCHSYDVAWPLFVEEDGVAHEFNMEKNSALIYRGTEHFHWREDRKQGQYCYMIFFHFVPFDYVGRLV